MVRDKAADFTRRMIAEAGIAPGARVLDVGCGNGIVTQMLAEAVGPAGSVLGVDRSKAAIEMARAQVHAENVDFEAVDLTDRSALRQLGRFDAIVGRRVLMYLADVSAVVECFADMLADRGVMAFHEHGSTGMPLLPAGAALHARLHDIIWETVRREGADPDLAVSLAGIMITAGFEIEATAEINVIVHGQTPDIPSIIRSMLERIEGQEVATATEIDVDTLAARLEDERARFGKMALWELMVATMGRKTA